MIAIRRQMLTFAQDVLKARSLEPLRRKAAHLVTLLAPRKRERKKLPRAPGRPAPAMTMGEIAEAVKTRAGGFCEACGKPFTGRDPFSVDHWMNGSGRREQLQSVETCWGLHKFTCHLRDRQEHRIPEWGYGPARGVGRAWRTESGVAFWNDVRVVHCLKYGYPFVPHIEHQPLRRRA